LLNHARLSTVDLFRASFVHPARKGKRQSIEEQAVQHAILLFLFFPRLPSSGIAVAALDCGVGYGYSKRNLYNNRRN